MYKVIIISPHLDDAIFSLGGFVLNNSLYQLTIVNVFTLSRYTVNGSGDQVKITALRLMEDHEVSKKLKFRKIDYRFRDASLRSRYLSEADYLDPRAETETDEVWPYVEEAVRTFIASNDYEFMFFPLALGDHIDHRILFEIGRRLFVEGCPVIFYEDGSYAFSCDEDRIRDCVAKTGLALSPLVFRVMNLEEKLEYVKMYQTQVDENIITTIAEAARRRGGETIWANTTTIERIVQHQLGR